MIEISNILSIIAWICFGVMWGMNISYHKYLPFHYYSLFGLIGLIVLGVRLWFI
ncbi:hypothetical protein [Methanobrevibacter sp. DSM 116169]|uniref:hypothetical protein n=1 Tax=Methanobrevibacter sp. DSM 116169 TaxID=3242727 RepID=UPI0038FC1024